MAAASNGSCGSEEPGEQLAAPDLLDRAGEIAPGRGTGRHQAPDLRRLGVAVDADPRPAEGADVVVAVVEDDEVHRRALVHEVDERVDALAAGVPGLAVVEDAEVGMEVVEGRRDGLVVGDARAPHASSRRRSAPCRPAASVVAGCTRSPFDVDGRRLAVERLAGPLDEGHEAGLELVELAEDLRGALLVGVVGQVDALVARQEAPGHRLLHVEDDGGEQVQRTTAPAARGTRCPLPLAVFGAVDSACQASRATRWRAFARCASNDPRPASRTPAPSQDSWRQRSLRCKERRRASSALYTKP